MSRTPLTAVGGYVYIQRAELSEEEKIRGCAASWRRQTALP
ncbi:MAG: hypothetical protein ACLRRT_08065 [Ruthenibacterium lactatiformans]